MSKPAKKTAIDFLEALGGEEQQVVRLALDAIQPDPNQPRQTFHAVDGIVPQEALFELENLAASIAEPNGVIQPIIVREVGPNAYMIVAGERRWRASKLAGRPDIPAIVRQDVSDKDVAMMQLAENVQRESMSDLDTAKFVKKMLEEYPELQKKDLAKLLNKHPSYVSRMMAFADPRWAHVVDTGLITYASVLEQFSSLSAASQKKLLDEAAERGSPVKAAEVQKAKKGESTGGAAGDSRDDLGAGGVDEQAGGAQEPLGQAVEKVLASQRQEGEVYQRKPEAVVDANRAGLVDAGSEQVIGLPTTPKQAAAVRDRLMGTQEVKMTLSQLAKLLNFVEVDGGVAVAISLDGALMKDAIEKLGGKVPEDAEWMQTALMESLNKVE